MPRGATCRYLGRETSRTDQVKGFIVENKTDSEVHT